MKYSLTYDVQQPAARSSFRPARMALPIGDPSLATRYGEKIRDEDTSPHGALSEVSVSTLQRPVESSCVSQSGLSIAPCPPGWSQSPWRKLTAEESCTGVHPNLGDIVWHKGREGVVVNSEWLEGEYCCDVCPIWSTCRQMAASWASQLGCNGCINIFCTFKHCTVVIL